MDILFHAHHAPLSPRLRLRTERELRKLERRLGGATSATVRFEEDGPTRRVEIIVLVARARRLIAVGEGRYFGTAVTSALRKLVRQARDVKVTQRARVGRTKRTRRAARV